MQFIFRRQDYRIRYITKWKNSGKVKHCFSGLECGSFFCLFSSLMKKVDSGLQMWDDDPEVGCSFCFVSFFSCISVHFS